MSENTMEISQLAKVLHQNGDKVLNALSKLSLNAVILQKLNKEFDTLIENELDSETVFEVVLSDSGNSELLRDLRFLHDFMQKTVGLKLTSSSSLSLLDNKIDISKFKSIKYLEIRKVPIQKVVGLKNIQSQLETIMCVRCLSKLEELLANCGGDKTSGFVWSELREAVLSFNNITVVDTSVAFAPWLQVLDLSHNQITDVKAIECLPNLKYVNLSFNCLDVIPTFNKSARKKIELLVIKSNYIEDLSGLQGLSHLTELDLSNNWVSSTESLSPILSMSTLQWLSLAGNPISFHQNYRRSVAGYLHISASFADFYLDRVRLSKKEKAVVGIKLCGGGLYLNKIEVERPTRNSPEESKSESQTGSSRKSGKGRVVVIPNLDDGTYEEEVPCDLSSSYFMTSSTEHLMTKKRIENTRSTYGVDNWLVHGSSVVQDILGLPPVQISHSTPCDDLCLQAALDSVKNVVTTTAVIESQPEPDLETSEKTNKDSFITCNEDSASNYFSVETSAEKVENVSNKQETKLEPEIVKPEPEVMKETSPDIEEIEEEEEVEIDENEKLFVVAKEVKTSNNESKIEELFLVITDTELQEREPIKGKVVTKWLLSLIESCVILKPNQLQFVFDTMRRDKRERTYSLEEQEATKLYKQIAEILENRTLSDMNQIVFKCEKCSSQFSKEVKSGNPDRNRWCPFCDSKLILELDEAPLPTSMEEKKKNGIANARNTEVKVSHNRSSSTGGFFQSLLGQSNREMLKCPSQSSIGSAASLDELNELPTIYNTNAKRSDSDIEILSNPSQSSIEVIDGPGRLGSTPNRKKSSEERQFVPAVSVVAAANIIQGNNPTGLTESSSSGSITDSICTAYEGNSNLGGLSKADGTPAVVEEPGEVDHTNSEDKNNVLLQGVLAKVKSIKTNPAADTVNYSYTDFTEIDHRIKLYLYTHVFEDSVEEFCFGLRADVLPLSASSEFPSCIVASNKKLYFLKVSNSEEGHDARDFLQKSDALSFELSAVKCIYTLSWRQGFGVKIQRSSNSSKEYLILLKDPSRTQRFLEFLTSTESHGLCKAQIIEEPLQRTYMAMQHLLLSLPCLEDSRIEYFSLFNFCSVTDTQGSKEMKSGGILTNHIELLLFEGSLNWLFDSGNGPPNPANCQKFSNLVQVYLGQPRLILQFFNGVEEKEVWMVQMETAETAMELLEIMRIEWENLFHVRLPLLLV